MEVLREVTIYSPEKIDDVVWFHDADFDANEISYDEEEGTVTIVFDQAVDQLPQDLGLPSPDESSRSWLNFIRFRQIMPFVQCELVIRHATGLEIRGDRDQSWGVLNDASYEPDRQVLRIRRIFGPKIEVAVKQFELAARASAHVRSRRRITTWFCIFESTGKRLPV